MKRTQELRPRHALIFCNGTVPPRGVVRLFLDPDPLIICADGGANGMARLGIAPDILVGDFDSIHPRTLASLKRRGVRIMHLPRQTDTDFEKALKLALSLRRTDVVVFGATGGLLDHTLGNFSILLRYAERMRIRLIDECYEIEAVSGRTLFSAEPGERISLIPWPGAAGVRTRGLKYLLKDESLALGFREGTCNEANAEQVSVSVRRGTVLVFRELHPRRAEDEKGGIADWGLRISSSC